MYRIMFLGIILIGSTGLAGSEKWYPSQTILEPTLVPRYSGINPDIKDDLIYLGFITDGAAPKQPMGQIYRFNGQQWNLEQYLFLETNPGATYICGKLTGDMCIVGVSGEPPTSKSMHVFQYDGNLWKWYQELSVSEDLGYGGHIFDVDQDHFIVRGEECAYAFGYNGREWRYQQKILPFDTHPSCSGFGDAIAISGNRCIIAAPLDEDGPYRIGTVYFYFFDGNAWIPDGKFTGLFTTCGGWDPYWLRVAMDSDWCIVGVLRWFNDMPHRVLIYRRTDHWTHHQELPSPWLESRILDAVFIRDGICGYSTWDWQKNNGSISLYSLNGSAWEPSGQITQPLAGWEGVWNQAIYDNGHLLMTAGVNFEEPPLNYACMFSATMFRPCPKADLTNDCRVDLLDFAALADEWMTGPGIDR